jgi:RNA polymerase sigma-70 factor (ECF subfamily)
VTEQNLKNDALNNSFTFKPERDEIESAKQGDQNAMHSLYMKYSSAMLNTSYRILNQREDAEDVLQESFIKAFKHLDQFKYQSTFGAWLKRIVVNLSIDELKRKKGIVFESEINDETHSTTSMDWGDDKQKKLDLFYTALHKLPDGYRTVLSLYLLEGYDHNEISQILNIGISTSISQLSRAKKKIVQLTRSE